MKQPPFISHGFGLVSLIFKKIHYIYLYCGVVWCGVVVLLLLLVVVVVLVEMHV